jgi:hypothetical protein
MEPFFHVSVKNIPHHRIMGYLEFRVLPKVSWFGMVFPSLYRRTIHLLQVGAHRLEILAWNELGDVTHQVDDVQVAVVASAAVVSAKSFFRYPMVICRPLQGHGGFLVTQTSAYPKK